MDNIPEPKFATVLNSILADRQDEGTYVKALSSSLKFFLQIIEPDGELALFIDSEELIQLHKDDLVSTAQIEVKRGKTIKGSNRVQLRLKDNSYQKIFTQFAHAATPRVQRCESNEEAAVTLLRIFRTWRLAFKGELAEGLHSNAQLGLYGELKTLKAILQSGVENEKAVNAWTGPEGTKQDFQIDGIALEVKSVVHSEPQKLTINGERQLDDTFFDALIITHHKVQRQNDAGETLPEIIDLLREQLSNNISATEMFEDKLLQAKYSDLHRDLYATTGYGISETHYYRVQPGFPNITESMLPIGVGSVRYVIDASACTNFAIDEETVFAWLTDNVAVEKLSDATMETVHEEYKKSVWKPTAKEHQGLNEKAKTAISKRLNGAIAKTVASFLNTEGGTLIIGKDDEGIITGIKEDMEFKEFKNLDEYQRALYQLLKNTIDEGIAGKVRIRFEEKNGLNVCLVHVKRSPTPHFCDDLESETKQRLLFIREDGASPALSPDRYAAYFQEHF